MAELKGNMMRTAEHEPKNWYIPYREGLSAVTGTGTQITSTVSGHYYATYGRDDQEFSKRPDASSFEFTGNGAVEVSIEAVLSEDVTASFVIVEYRGDSYASHSYTTPRFIHAVGAETDSLTLAVRIKGQGTVSLGEVKVETYLPVYGWESSVPVTHLRSVSLGVSSFAIDELPTGTALMAVNFTDRDGLAVLPEADTAINPRVGPYAYVNHGSFAAPRSTVFEIEVPSGADRASFSIVPWKPGAIYLTEEPVVGGIGLPDDSNNEETIASFIAEIPDSDTLIVLYTTAPQLGHQTLALRPNRLTKEYLGLGCWVVFFPFSKVPVGEEVQGPKVRQYSRDNIGEFLTAASRRAGRNNVFICSSFPDIVAVGAVDLLKLHGWSTVYEVRDDMEEFNRVGYSKWFHPQLEARVANQVDTVVTVSPRLAKKMDTLCNKVGHATVIPNAVERGFIDRCVENRSEASYASRSGSQTVGYLGHLTASWFDWRLLISAAEQLPTTTFEIIGHGMPAELDLPANIVYLGPKNHEEFRRIALKWKVGLIPFKPSTLTYAVDPNKVYEYLAVGLRTVTARMGAVEMCPSTWIYDRPEYFVESLVEAMATPFEVEEVAEIETFLLSSTWRNRALTMLDTIGAAK